MSLRRKEDVMASGGFLIKFDGKKADRCFSVKFDYDDWTYLVNEKKKKALPSRVKSITIEVE